MSGHAPLADVLRLTACNLEAIRRGALYKDFYTGAQGESGDTITKYPFLHAVFTDQKMLVTARFRVGKRGELRVQI